MEDEGYAHVPVYHAGAHPKLGRWVTQQRDLFGQGRLNRERVALLEALPGWSWDPSADDWEEGFRHLAAFVKREGHARESPRSIGEQTSAWRLG